MPPAAPPLMLFDTGPLLVFAATPAGPGLLQARYHGRALVVTDIDRELTGLQRNHVPPVAAAARHAVVSYGWMQRVTVDDPAMLERAEWIQSRIQAFKRYPAKDNKRRDWGESVTLAVAEQRAAAAVVVVVANEDDVREVSTRLRNRVGVATAVQVLRGMVRSGQLTDRQAFAMCTKARTATLDVGEVVRSAADLR